MRKNFIKRYAGILLVVLMLVSMLYTDTSITSAAGEYVYGTGGSSVITDGAANVTGDGSVITDGAVNVTGNGSVITDGAVNVTGGSVTEVTNDSSVSYTPPVLDEAEEPKKAYNTPVWTGDVDEKFAGKGTKTAPYLIYTPEEFAGMLVTSKENSGAYYKLMNDIDLGGKPLRSNNPDGEWGGCNWGKLEFESFNGHFDGNYCLISGFYQKTEYQEKSGVFRHIDSGASVENVILTGRNDCGSAFAGSTYGLIKNCTNYVE